MLLDVQLERGVVTAAATAARAERAGFSGVWAAEVTRDPMLSLAAASTSTKHITLGSNVVLAFARNPMSVAQQAWDLAEATRGRFLLGLATQVKPHITRRYSMPFTDPVGRMRDFVLAVRHIHEVFMGKHPMDYRGSHYSHTLLRRWDELAGLVDDAMLDHFALRSTLEELPARIRTRYGDYYDRAVPYLPPTSRPRSVAPVHVGRDGRLTIRSERGHQGHLPHQRELHRPRPITCVLRARRLPGGRRARRGR